MVLGAVLASGCTKPRPPPAGDEQRRALLKAVGEGVIVPVLEQFASDASALGEKTAGYATARTSGPAVAELDAARTAFRSAFLTWQRAEMLQVGPAGASFEYTGGQDLRDSIYSWPLTSPCRVDTHLVQKAYEAAGFFDTALVTSVGLDELEYLLHSGSMSNRCDASAAINTSGQWATLSADELSQRRSNYAQGAAAHLSRQAARLLAAWREEGFLEKLSNAGRPESPFPTSQDAVDQLFRAFFVLDRIKDDKLGTPAGLTAACQGGICPRLAEALDSGLSREALVANLEAERAVMRGGFSEGGRGFDAYLAARGSGALGEEMIAALDEAIASVGSLDAPVDRAVVSELEDVRAVHAKIKAFTDLMKSRFAPALTLRVPQEGAGDSD